MTKLKRIYTILIIFSMVTYFNISLSNPGYLRVKEAHKGTITEDMHI